MIIPYISLFSDSPVLCIFLRTYNRSPDINDVSDIVTNLESPFERDTGSSLNYLAISQEWNSIPSCLEGSQDFDDDGDCNLSPDLLRMVEHEEKQILPHKETVEVVNLGDELEKKEVKIRFSITTGTKRDLIELLQKFKDVFAWSYQDMPRLSADIVVHRLPIKEECKQVQ